MTPSEPADTGANETAKTTERDALLEVDTVSVSFDTVPVLENVSFEAARGEFVGLVGPNGAGKTTLLRAISGALTPTDGTVSVDGVDLAALSSSASSRLVSVVPQDTSISFAFDIERVVEMGRTPYRSRFVPPTAVDRAHVDRALERTRTATFADRSIDEVSGGERQRVVLARAIAQDTPVMLLDEPTASLDVNHQVETLDLVRDLVDGGRTVVAAIHDLDLAARYCDRLVVLADGAVHATGTPQKVLTRETLEAAFDASAAVTPNPITGTPMVTPLSAARRRRDGQLERGEQLPERVHVVGTGSAAADVLRRLEAADIGASVGPASSGDAAAEAARSLDVDRIVVEPFTALTEDVRDALERRTNAADVVVLADLEIATGNQLLLETLSSLERLVVVETRPFADRNFAGEEAKKRYEACRKRALEATPESVLEAVLESHRTSTNPHLESQAESSDD